MPNESFINKLRTEQYANTKQISQLKILTNRERDAERRERTHRLIEKEQSLRVFSRKLSICRAKISSHS